MSEERSQTWLSFRYGQDSKGRKKGDLIWHLDWSSKDGPLGAKTFSAVHRARFLDEMVKLLPEGLTSFNKSLESVEETGKGVQLSFADGSVAEHSALIGCDGIKSTVRRIMLGEEHPEVAPRFTGEYCYRALVPRTVADEVLGAELAGNGQLYCGYGGFVITYPVDQGKLINMAAVKQTQKKEWEQDQWIIPSSTQDMQEDFKGWDPKIVDIISRFENKDQWAFFDVSLSCSYAKGRTCLLGDAAHASTPHLGSGAGMAFEDAYIMGNLLGAVNTEEDLSMAFLTFDEVRGDRTRKLVQRSRQAGLANEMLNRKVMDDFDRLEKDIDVRYRWIWDEDLEAMCQDALQKLRIRT